MDILAGLLAVIFHLFMKLNIDITKDTILRSTINDYFENEPDGRLTAWVNPPLRKTLPQWQIYLPQILK